jgi:hypothetical protein
MSHPLGSCTSQDSSVGTVTRLYNGQPKSWGLIPSRGTPSLPYSGYRVLFTLVVEPQGHEADHSHPSHAKVEWWSCTSTLASSSWHAWCLIN